MIDSRAQETERARVIEALLKAWREKAADIVDVRPPKGWPPDWQPLTQSAENKAYCDGKARGLTYAADQLEAAQSALVSSPCPPAWQAKDEAFDKVRSLADDMEESVIDYNAPFGHQHPCPDFQGDAAACSVCSWTRPQHDILKWAKRISELWSWHGDAPTQTPLPPVPPHGERDEG